jgi:hypothetical protein
MGNGEWGMGNREWGMGNGLVGDNCYIINKSMVFITSHYQKTYVS